MHGAKYWELRVGKNLAFRDFAGFRHNHITEPVHFATVWRNNLPYQFDTTLVNHSGHSVSSIAVSTLMA